MSSSFCILNSKHISWASFNFTSRNTLLSRRLPFLFQPIINTPRVHCLLHVNVQISQCFFFFLLFKLLKLVWSLVSFLVRLPSNSISNNFLGYLEPLNELVTPNLRHFIINGSSADITCHSLSLKMNSRFLFFAI